MLLVKVFIQLFLTGTPQNHQPSMQIPKQPATAVIIIFYFYVWSNHP